MIVKKESWIKNWKVKIKKKGAKRSEWEHGDINEWEVKRSNRVIQQRRDRAKNWSEKVEGRVTSEVRKLRGKWREIRTTMSRWRQSSAKVKGNREKILRKLREIKVSQSGKAEKVNWSREKI